MFPPKGRTGQGNIAGYLSLTPVVNVCKHWSYIDTFAIIYIVCSAAAQYQLDLLLLSILQFLRGRNISQV